MIIFRKDILNNIFFCMVFYFLGSLLVVIFMFWKENLSFINQSQYTKDVFDVIIIGAGITGVSTAYHLKDSNLKIALFDRDKIGSGVTSRSSAKITYLQGDIYQRLKDKAKKYYLSQKDAIKLILQAIKKEKITCDLEIVPSVLFCVDEKNRYKIQLEKEILESFGASTFAIRDSRVKDGFGIKDSYVFHPLKFLSELCRSFSSNISIYQNTVVVDIKKVNGYYLLQTNQGIYYAKDVVVSCHYPFFLLPNMFPLKTYVKREYVNACKFPHSSNFTAINVDSDLHSIRFYHDYLLYGSGSHRLTNEIDFGKHYEDSRKQFKKFFGKTPEFTWDNQDIVSNDLLPFIGKIDHHLYLGSAYRGWGMTNGFLAGKIISDSILAKANPYYSLFDPNRNNFVLFTNSFLGTFHYMKVYIDSFCHRNPSYLTINGLRYILYEDKEHKKYKICLLCPHLKCHLVYNYYDKTWDCPCHGSRFLLDGTVIKGPAVFPLKKVV